MHITVISFGRADCEIIKTYWNVNMIESGTRKMGAQK